MLNESLFNVVLVGRPNVGKSSIFNFLISKNEARVEDEDGTTIDWRSHQVGNIVLWDSPGNLQLQSLPVTPNLLYFVVENLILDYDKRLYLQLKSKYPNILVIINKIDKGEDFDYSFFDNYITISLRSRFNIFKFKSLFLDNYVELPQKDKKIWAILGKPNVGKSSLINALLDYDLHKVEDFEGTTKEYLPVDIDENILVDTPGQRQHAFFPKYSNIFGIIIVTDLKNERQDLRLIGLALQRNKPVLLVINKLDLASKDILAHVTKRFETLFHVPIVFTSCVTKVGLSSVLKHIQRLQRNYFKRISTHLLNDWLFTEIKRFEPKLKFISQVETAYPRFYINSPILKDKEIMLRKRLSEKFDFKGIPIKFIYK